MLSVTRAESNVPFLFFSFPRVFLGFFPRIAFFCLSVPSRDGTLQSQLRRYLNEDYLKPMSIAGTMSSLLNTCFFAVRPGSIKSALAPLQLSNLLLI